MSTNNNRPASKVARLIEEYELEGLGADLEARWTGDDNERMSLRDLATFFNQQLLRQALIAADNGTGALDNTVETIYTRLTSDNVSSGVRTDTRSRLEQRGVDINSLESDFVTYQAIRSYLKDWRGAEYQTISDEAKIQKDLESIQRLMSRTTSVTEERIEKLRETDRIALDAFEVLLDVQVLCQACGDQHSVTELLERDGCPCQISSND
ncbi:rod-determining factor RdfA [Haloquadratum walsbyi]|jgi:hypothetical protein|uniref:Uncharacterized protein n=1 Tax=Haloquadratum walsbyi (strain DSM 16790 / HBSQ001) TaxID=362976 RepID=Q18J65_HALWD|nr:rod-determining factor RdfA [Haloquadratum walsbyi]CAJ51946.1 uncharacterized protein HQ_1818A [Haloquadratum walsbyi DSM 16790]